MIQEDIGTLSYEIYLGQPLLHAEINKWDRKTKKECMEHLEDLKVYFKEKGYSTMRVGADRSDKKLQKFLDIFGFELIAFSDNSMLYSQEIG